MLTVLYWILMVFYIPACIGLIVIVLLQKGKGSGFAGAFGVGAGSETVFGPRARRSLPVKLTYISAALFMTLALIMSMISGRANKGAAPQLAEQQETPAAVTGLEDLRLGEGEAAAGQEAEPAEEGEDAPAQAEIETFEEEPAVEEAAPIEEPAVEEAAPIEEPAETPAEEPAQEEPEPTPDSQND